METLGAPLVQAFCRWFKTPDLNLDDFSPAPAGCSKPSEPEDFNDNGRRGYVGFQYGTQNQATGVALRSVWFKSGVLNQRVFNMARKIRQQELP
jgi:hypothetical protein